MAETDLLEVAGLHAGYGVANVLHGLDFAVAQRGVTTLLGANGAGKTTTLRAISGLLRIDGTIRFNGAPIAGTATEDIVRLGAYVRKDKAGVAADTERVLGYFPRLRQRIRQQAGTLSGGEQQMLAISRALLLRPKLLLLDEPSFGLAPLIVRDIFDIMRRINQEQGSASWWSSRMPILHSTSPTMPICWKPAASSCLAPPLTFVRMKRSVNRIWDTEPAWMHFSIRSSPASPRAASMPRWRWRW